MKYIEIGLVEDYVKHMNRAEALEQIQNNAIDLPEAIKQAMGENKEIDQNRVLSYLITYGGSLTLIADHLYKQRKLLIANTIINGLILAGLAALLYFRFHP